MVQIAFPRPLLKRIIDVVETIDCNRDVKRRLTGAAMSSFESLIKVVQPDTDAGRHMCRAVLDQLTAHVLLMSDWRLYPERSADVQAELVSFADAVIGRVIAGRN